jgi:hypothetical protein
MPYTTIINWQVGGHVAGVAAASSNGDDGERLVTVAEAKNLILTGPSQMVDAALVMLKTLPQSFQDARTINGIEVDTHEHDPDLVLPRCRKDKATEKAPLVVTMMRDTPEELLSEVKKILDQPLGDMDLTCTNCKGKVKLSTAEFCRLNKGAIPGNLYGMPYTQTNS